MSWMFTAGIKNSDPREFQSSMKMGSGWQKLWQMKPPSQSTTWQPIQKGTKMPDLPKKKVGIVSCSGEELAEGTITRLATRKVLDQLRPEDTVTICLPLFLAGGEGDRAFAKFYPTIAVDGCELRCAARGTEKYSSKPAASIMVRDIILENNFLQT